MKIRAIRAAGLVGATPEGGWSDEIQPDECIHTLIAVLTDEGVTGLGSVYTNDGLVKAALRLLEPLYLGENALEPERVSEKLHQPLMQRVNQQNRREIPEYRPEDDRKIIQPCCDCAW